MSPTQKKHILITICAKGKNEGLRDKHLRKFHGKRLIVWTMDQALQWAKGDIIVSSDNLKILNEAALKSNIIAYRRPNKLAHSKISKLDAIRDAVLKAEKMMEKKYSVIIDLDVTNCLRTKKDIDACLNLFRHHQPDVVISVVRSRRSPYFNMLEKSNGKIKLCKQSLKWNSIDYIYRRQDIPDTYDLNSSIYVYDRNWLLNTDYKLVTLAENIKIYIMPNETFCDIDTGLDYFISDQMWNLVEVD